VADKPFDLAGGQYLNVSVSIGVAALDDYERDHAIEGVAQQLVARPMGRCTRRRKQGATGWSGQWDFIRTRR
jgi:hypothetical protein